MSEKGAREMERYTKRVQKMLDSMTPWNKKSILDARPNPYGLKSGEVAVVLEGGESLPEDFIRDAKVIRR